MLSSASIPAPAALRHVCIVRADLPSGVQAANLIHAAGESSPGGLPRGTYAVALHAPDEPALRRLTEKLRAVNIRFVAICETDPPYCGELMAVGVCPMSLSAKRELDKITGALPLVRGAHKEDD